VKLSAQITSLQREIDLAIKKEEYETAASLRDEVRKLKSLMENGNDSTNCSG
jgi:protein-arginine kinase activator protein McsA